MGKVVLENDIGAASEFVEYPLRLPFGDVRIIPQRKECGEGEEGDG